MTIYRSSRKDSDVRSNMRRENSKYGNESAEGARERCRCGRKCSNQCPNDSNNGPQTEFNFSNNNDNFVEQVGSEYAFLEQESAEIIWVKESCNITVNTTDTQAGVSLQVGLQLAIALVLNITIADSEQREAVSQELMQQFSMNQTNRQKIFIYNTKDAVVTTQDTDLALNVQALLQVLLTLVLLVDIF